MPSVCDSWCADYYKLMGSPEAAAVVTMHVLVRPPQTGKAAGAPRVLLWASGQVQVQAAVLCPLPAIYGRAGWGAR